MTTDTIKRWTLFHGAFTGPERTAAIELQRGAQFHLPYVIPVRPASCGTEGAESLLLVGTVASNPVLGKLLIQLKAAAPTAPGSYLLHVGPNPLQADTRVIAVIGADAAGTLHGVAEMLAVISDGGVPLDMPVARRARIDGLQDLHVLSVPAVAQRGLWTWGYVIYDYRRYIDHMVRLRMNTLTMWNDVVPVNMAEIITYAHDRGISVHAGFQWGWGIKELDISKAADRATIRDSVLKTWRDQYADLAIDGLYFQTITEHTTQEFEGRSVASWCCELINPIARELWQLRPNLSIQFGLHATSIAERFTDLDQLDPRLTITWEDAGALPFAVNPKPEGHNAALSHGYEATLAYAKRLAQWRPGSRFAMVPKGWMMLRWGVEFANHGPFICGERDARFIRDRLAARQGEWDWNNQLWYRNYPLAARFYRELLAVAPQGVLATGLVEDALFEERIQPSVSLFAESLWNPHQSDAEILIRAMRPYARGSDHG